MSVLGSQNYKEMVQLALRAKKLANERGTKGKFQKKKVLGSRLGSPQKKVEVLNLRGIHLDQVLNL